MADNANTHPIPDYEDIWNQLTVKQQAFVDGILTGKTQAQAYRDAYDVSPTAGDNGVRVSASREASKPNVALCIELSTYQNHAFTLEEHNKALRRIALKAEKEGKHGAAISAYQTLGKAAGMYIEQIKDVTETDPHETLRTIAETAPELAEAIAKQVGLDFKSPESVH